MSPGAQRRAFLSELRRGPGFIGWLAPNSSFRQRWFADDEEALRIVERYADEANVWCSMASFDAASQRRAADAGLLKCYWLDVDAHGKRYGTPEECVAALGDFVNAACLPSPNYRHLTGHGVQAFWVLPDPIPRAEWQPVADMLQELSQRLDLGADPITADAARILRVPGTFNFRDPEEPRKAVLEELDPNHIELDGFRAAIATALTKLSPPKQTQGQQLPAGLQNTSENAALVRAMLAVIDPDADYDEWRKIIWAVAASGLPGAHDLAREWSEKGALWNEKRFETIWSSFDPSREKSIGFGTLVYKAREAGFAGSVSSTLEFDQLSFKRGEEGVPRSPGSLVTQRAADIEPAPVDWLVEGAIPLGMLVVIGGQPGLGKSQIGLKLASAVTTGQGLPNGSHFAEIGSVIVLANEDDAARTIRPRLDAAGADITKVQIVQGIAREGQRVDHFQLDTDVAALREKAKELGDVRLIIIDPPSAYLGPKVDAYKESDVRRVLAPLSQLAQETGALVLLVVHLNKRNDGGAQQRFGGSTAWIAAPRAAFLVAEEESTRRRFMLPVKNNLGNDRLGFEYRVVEKLLEYPSGTIKAPHIEWVASSDRRAGELLNPPKPKGPNALDEAKDFLSRELAGGPKPSTEVQAAAKAAGISPATLNRAKAPANVRVYRNGDVWVWANGRRQQDG